MFEIERTNETDYVPRDFLDECDVLYAMRTINHPHLLKVIATFKRSNQCGFIMPRSGGSLQTIWETQFNSALESENLISWLFEQFLGITDGLAELHQEKFDYQVPMSHGGLTPDNILWFPGHESDRSSRSLGALIVGDTGRTKHYTEQEGEKFDAKARYTMQKGRPSPREDVWSLGLICFEFVIWLIRGQNEVRKFRLQSPYGHLSDLDRWTSFLMTDERCLPGTPLGWLLQFVGNFLNRQVEVREDDELPSARDFHLWIKKACEVVNTSGSSYVAVYPDLRGIKINS